MSPVSARHSGLVYDTLKACGVRIVSALPETWLVHLIRMAEDDPEMTLVRLAKEEEGVGVSLSRFFVCGIILLQTCLTTYGEGTENGPKEYLCSAAGLD